MTCLLLLLNSAFAHIPDDEVLEGDVPTDAPTDESEEEPGAEPPVEEPAEAVPEAEEPVAEPTEEPAAVEPAEEPVEEPVAEPAEAESSEPATEAIDTAPIVWRHGVVRRERAPRYPGVALALSLTGTVGSALLTVAPTAGWLPEPAFYAGMAGLIFAPSLGQVYTREHDRVYFTSSLRLMAAGVGVGGAFVAETNPAIDLGVITPTESTGQWMMLGSGVLIGGIALYDVIDSPFSARRVSPPAVSLSPTGAMLTWDW